MIYLTGSTSDRYEQALIAAGIGLMLNADNSYHLRVHRYPWWAADIVGMHNRGDLDQRFDWLDRLPRERCLFAVSPDAYPSAVESQRRGLEFAPLIRDMGFPVAVVAQDGAEDLVWPWDELDVLFIGGEKRPNPKDEWKISGAAEGLVHEARNHGKWVHMGRVNSFHPKRQDARVKRARAMGCHSCDGTFTKYRRRLRAGEPESARDSRGASEIAAGLAWLDANQPLNLFPLEGPSLPVHRAALASKVSA